MELDHSDLAIDVCIRFMEAGSSRQKRFFRSSRALHEALCELQTTGAQSFVLSWGTTSPEARARVEDSLTRAGVEYQSSTVTQPGGTPATPLSRLAIPKPWEIEFQNITLAGWGLMLLSAAALVFTFLGTMILGLLLVSFVIGASVRYDSILGLGMGLLAAAAARSAGRATYQAGWYFLESRGRLVVRRWR